MTIIKLINIALRNLFRNSRRTFITVLVSASGFAALAIIAGYMEFTFFGLREMTICKGFTASGGTGHLQVFMQDALQKEERYPLEFGIEVNDKLQSNIESTGNVSFTIPRVEFNGLISNGEKSISFLGMGVDPVKESKLIEYWYALDNMSSKAVRADSSFTQLKNTAPNGVLLGEEMAKALNVKNIHGLLIQPYLSYSTKQRTQMRSDLFCQKSSTVQARNHFFQLYPGIILLNTTIPSSTRIVSSSVFPVLSLLSLFF